jgi:hypothetical protein
MLAPPAMRVVATAVAAAIARSFFCIGLLLCVAGARLSPREVDGKTRGVQCPPRGPQPRAVSVAVRNESVVYVIEPQHDGRDRWFFAAATPAAKADREGSEDGSIGRGARGGGG